MKISAVPPDLLEAIWPAAEPLIAKALAFHPHLQSDGVEQLLHSGNAQLIVVVDDGKLKGAVVIECVNFYRLRVVNIIALGAGRGFYAKYLTPATEFLEGHARNLGATRLGGYGRCGWERYFKRHGCKTTRVLMGWKEL